MENMIKLLHLDVTSESLMANLVDSSLDLDTNLGVNSIENLTESEKEELFDLITSMLVIVRNGIIRTITE